MWQLEKRKVNYRHRRAECTFGLIPRTFSSSLHLVWFSRYRLAIIVTIMVMVIIIVIVVIIIIAILVTVIIIIIIVPCLVLKDPRYWFAQANRATERAASIVATSRYSRPGNSCDIDIENIDIRSDNSCNIDIEYVDIDNSRSIILKPDECIQGTFKPASLQDSRLSTFWSDSITQELPPLEEGGKVK